jgi:membrane protease YdiL (CAAX protease family)
MQDAEPQFPVEPGLPTMGEGAPLPGREPEAGPRSWALTPEPEPLFGLAAVVCVFLATLLAVLFCGTAAVVLAHHVPALRRAPVSELASDARVLLPAQLAAYLIIFAGLYRYFGHHMRVGVLRALRWRWPTRWVGFVAAGAVLGVAVQWSSQWLPSPPELPIEAMLRTATDAWLMTFFGVLIAPFAEELLFRGLLFPALARRAGAVVSLVLTSLLFGAVHAQQLAGAWAQVGCIAVVGLVLTGVRWRFRSLACSTLVHAGYNGVLFAALFVQTRGFTHLGN